jgi:SAM domain (Sterile alpha motif)
MAQATNPHTTSRFHNLSSGALADALGRIPRERNRRHGLPNLTGEDLKELGVNALGHRRILLDAIAALRGDTQASLPKAPQTVDRSATDTAERRQVTVMFSDLVGSTALAARMCQSALERDP